MRCSCELERRRRRKRMENWVEQQEVRRKGDAAFQNNLSKQCNIK